MKFILNLLDNSDELLLPVPPQEFTIQQGNNNQVVTVENAGELNFVGRPKLTSITLSSFFPNQQYPFCVYTGFPTPYDCVRKIDAWRTGGKILKLNIENTKFNLVCCIESFSYGEKDGSGDVYFTLELKEYRFVKADTKNSEEGQSSRQQTKEPAKTYVVKKGDTLWAISKREYGDGSKWNSIAQKNGIKDPKKLQIGQRLVL